MSSVPQLIFWILIARSNNPNSHLDTKLPYVLSPYPRMLSRLFHQSSATVARAGNVAVVLRCVNAPRWLCLHSATTPFSVLSLGEATSPWIQSTGRKTTTAKTVTISCRSFHASSPRTAARRRRRRGQATIPSTSTEDDGDEDDDNDDKNATTANRPVPIRRVTDPAVFDAQATQLLDTIFAALQPLQAINNPFFLSRDRDPDIHDGEYILLDLGPLHGQYTLQVDPEQALVHLQTPISGVIQYYHDLDDGEWRSVEDGHILQGLLVRDLIRQIQGVPQL